MHFLFCLTTPSSWFDDLLYFLILIKSKKKVKEKMKKKKKRNLLLPRPEFAYLEYTIFLAVKSMVNYYRYLASDMFSFIKNSI